jgi:hypothetical protein
LADHRCEGVVFEVPGGTTLRDGDELDGLLDGLKKLKHAVNVVGVTLELEF